MNGWEVCGLDVIVVLYLLAAWVTFAALHIRRKSNWRSALLGALLWPAVSIGTLAAALFAVTFFGDIDNDPQ